VRVNVPRWTIAAAAGVGVGVGAAVVAKSDLFEPVRRKAEQALVGLGIIGGTLVNEPIDLVRHRVEGPPTGPFPGMADLNARFPAARLPAHLAGTSIDHDLLVREGAEPLMAKAAAMGMNVVRYGPQWNDIETSGPGSGDLRVVDDLLDAAERHGIRVIFTVGEKAPAWPEHHIPEWLRDGAPEGRVPGGLDVSGNERLRSETMRWVERLVRHVDGHPALAMWQVENEPYDASGPQMTYLSADMVRDEVELVHRLDGGRLPVMVTTWSESDRGTGMRAAFDVADAVGIDVYQQLPYDAWGLDRFGRTTGMPERALRLAKETGKPAIVAELQAEDWLPTKVTADQVRDNTNHLEGLGFQDLLWWRMDGWLQQERSGDHSITDEVARQAAETYQRWGDAPPARSSQ
jgi:hypothetical protein